MTTSEPQNQHTAPNAPGEGNHTRDDATGAQNRNDSPNSEAARYRRQLRDTETERDGLRAQLDAFRTADAERIASTGERGPRLYAGDELWRDGGTVADVLDEDGTVSEARVRELVETITADRAHLRADFGPQRPRPDYSQAKQFAPKSDSNWQGLIQNA